jgi:hypothetical protein
MPIMPPNLKNQLIFQIQNVSSLVYEWKYQSTNMRNKFKVHVYSHLQNKKILNIIYMYL